jgi:hypothetical protein
MIKRVIAVSIGLLLIGAVVAALAGAAMINTAQAQGPRGGGGGRWAAESGAVASNPDGCQPQGQGQGQGGVAGQGQGQGQGSVAGQGQGQGQGSVSGQGQGRNREATGPEVTVSGVVTVAEFELGEEPRLSIQTGDGVTVQVELGPEWYIESQAFTANVGDQLTVLGHYDGEGTALIAHTITNETTGVSTFFRDGTGRPAWAGRGRRWSNPTTAPTS